MLKSIMTLSSAGLLIAATSMASAAPTQAQVHIRGTIQSVSPHSLTVTSAAGPVTISLAPKLGVTDAVPSDRAHITANGFVGITSVTEPNGSQRAVEVHIFPPSMRGAGEGTRPWDFPGVPGHHGSRMTNGTVSGAHNPTTGAPHSRMTNGTVSAHGIGAAFTITYKQGGGAGSQSIVIPAGIPIVYLQPGSTADLKPGASVFVMAQRKPDGTLAASRVLVGKNGARPPM